MPDGLSRRQKGENEDEGEKDDVDEEGEWSKTHPGFFLKEGNTRKVGKLSRNKIRNNKIPIKQEGFGKHVQEYLSSLKNSQSIGKEFLRRIKRRSVSFYLEEGKLKEEIQRIHK
ncbi:hypothetical protein O181_018451 [Austropuccinia psidii MF-1]|uniref:Uncharacterized protein n=1 Tax=Austropuccinia psidii MF-1 TaxID=1389203 RepID=A0A9Q3GSY9_9BASI|nr:hypothetical protein [Austropuccinia psidii MF-1]